jgi:hypothetical protein
LELGISCLAYVFSRIHIVSEERANQFFPEKVDRFMGNAEGWNASFDFVSHDEGAATHVVAAFEIDIASKPTSLPVEVLSRVLISIEQNGAYLEKGKVVASDSERIKPWATSSVEAEKLWKLSEKLVGQSFSY